MVLKDREEVQIGSRRTKIPSETPPTRLREYPKFLVPHDVLSYNRVLFGETPVQGGAEVVRGIALPTPRICSVLLEQSDVTYQLEQLVGGVHLEAPTVVQPSCELRLAAHPMSVGLGVSFPWEEISHLGWRRAPSTRLPRRSDPQRRSIDGLS